MSIEATKHSHYFHDVAHLNTVDIYRMLALLDIAHPALQHAFKKVAAAGKRGAKSAAQDVQEAIDSLKRWQEMQREDFSLREARTLAALEQTLERRSSAVLAPFWRESDLLAQVERGEFKAGGTD